RRCTGCRHDDPGNNQRPARACAEGRRGHRDLGVAPARGAAEDGDGATVVLVNVAFSADTKDVPRQPADKPFTLPPGGLPKEFSELVDGLEHPGDVRITKRQWGAFYGTELDLQLRRRGIQTIVLGGISTNIGVESTARHAWEHGYALVLVEDAMSSSA